MDRRRQIIEAAEKYKQKRVDIKKRVSQIATMIQQNRQSQKVEYTPMD